MEHNEINERCARELLEWVARQAGSGGAAQAGAQPAESIRRGDTGHAKLPAEVAEFAQVSRATLYRAFSR